MIREITENDYEGLMRLYMQLHDNPFPERNASMEALWRRILEDKDLMLLTGSKRESTLHFYEQAGYNRKDKTAFIQWI